MKHLLLCFPLFFSAIPAFANFDFGLQLRSQVATEVLMQDLGLRADSKAQLTRFEIQPQNESDLVEVTLKDEKLGEIRLVMKGPKGFTTNSNVSLRALLLVSGFATGASSVQVLGQVPNTVLIGFHYPYGAEDFRRDPGLILQLIRKTPGQVALALKWLSAQRWLAPHELAAVGVSLGGFFLPVSLHLAQQIGVTVDRTVFVCAGASIAPVIIQNLKSYVAQETLEMLAHQLGNLTALHDPKLHLPFLTGNFLSVRSNADQTIPLESSSLLFETLAQPKTEVVIEGPHINVDQLNVIQQTQTALLNWFPPLK